MELYDAVVVGAGVVGCAIARELSRYDLKILVLEKELDVATGNSSRNTGMLHAGFTYKLGTLRAKCSVEGNQEFDQVSQELGVPFKRTGKLVVGFTDHDRENILRFKANGEANGVKGIRMVDPEEMHRIEPNAGGNFAMYVPASGILDPMQYTIALGENACKNGAEFSFGSRVIGIEPLDGARQQQVLELYYDRHLPTTEIARLLGVRRSTVSRTLCRARTRLYKALRYSL